MRVHDHIYHVACFTCYCCGRNLQKGDEYATRGSHLICKHDLEKELMASSMYADQCSSPSCGKPSMTDLSMALNGLHTSRMSPMMDSQPLTLLQSVHTPDSYSPRNALNGTICDSMGQPLSVKSEPIMSPSSHPHSTAHMTSNMINSTGSNVAHPMPIKQDGRRGPKRPRTILTTAQRRAFKASFEISQKPCRKV